MAGVVNQGGRILQVIQPLDLTLNRVLVALIRGYQRYISPYKGYSCAHRAKYGGDSCSEYARKVIADADWRTGVGKMRTRFLACRAASRSLKAIQLHDGVRDEDIDGPLSAGLALPPKEEPAPGTGERFGPEIAECCCQGGAELCCMPPVEQIASECCAVHLC
jgi:putative component of membrane protein insertase Oxa1/YidC/SpoIIIJ protein YidD